MVLFFLLTIFIYCLRFKTTRRPLE